MAVERHVAASTQNQALAAILFLYRHVLLKEIGYLRYRGQRVRLNRGDAAALRHFMEFLNREGVIPAEKVAAPRPTAVERSAQEYEHYLREERVLATATILNYVPFVRCFLKDRFGSGTVRLSRLCAGDVIRFVERRRADCVRKERSC
jgi:hypothetical protein